MKHRDITHTYNEEEIEILKRDKSEIVKASQNLKNELEGTNPNIQIIHQFKEKLNDFRIKEKSLRECESFIQIQKEKLNHLKK